MSYGALKFDPSSLYDIIAFIVQQQGGVPVWGTHKKEIVEATFNELLDGCMGNLYHVLRKDINDIRAIDDDVQSLIHNRIKEECISIIKKATMHIPGPLTAVIESDEAGFIISKSEDTHLRTNFTGLGEYDGKFIKQCITDGDWYPERIRRSIGDL